MATNIPQSNPDRLTALPDSLLHVILSWLPFDEAVRTSTLSSDWKNLWKHLEHINLRHVVRWHNSDFVDAVHRTLSQSSCLNINKFSLRLGIDHQPLDKLIELGLSRHVKTFTLAGEWAPWYSMSKCFSDASSLENLTIRGSWARLFWLDPDQPLVRWTCLKFLHLSNVKVTDVVTEKVLPGCPVLETLVLEHTLMSEGTNVLELSTVAPSVKTLWAVNVQCDVFGSSFYVDAPRLEYLYYTGNPVVRRVRATDPYISNPMVFKNASSSLKANLSLCDLGYYKTRNSQEIVEFGTSLLESLFRANELVLGRNFIYATPFMEPSKKPCPLWCRDLTINLHACDKEFQVITRLFQRSPCVERLVINVEWRTKDAPSVQVLNDAFRLSLPKVKFRCLKYLKISHTFCCLNSYKRPSYLRLAACIANNVPLLEELVIAIVPAKVKGSNWASRRSISRLSRVLVYNFSEWFNDGDYTWKITVKNSVIEIVFKRKLL